MHSYTAIGIMSGTSLDGLDISFCRYKNDGDEWAFEIISVSEYSYTLEFQERLRNAHLLSAEQYFLLERDFTELVMEKLQFFLSSQCEKPELIAFHGHTVFHQPNERFTVQMGNGAAIAAQTGISVVCDFRRTDVGLGGEGAPLVPIGDLKLFHLHQRSCLNLGGIANASYYHSENVIAYDICFCNMLLNAICHENGLVFDEGGAIAARGTIYQPLLKLMNDEVAKTKKVKASLGKELFEGFYANTVAQFSDLSIEDKMRTSVEYIAQQVVENLPKNGAIMVTGGGAKNDFLLEQFNSKGNNRFFVPDEATIQYKEAIVFGFLGVLRMLEQPNALQSVTKASRNSCGGAIYSSR